MPLRIGEVALAPRQMPGVRTVKERDREAVGLELIVDGDPIHAGGLHGHGVDCALFEPRAQRAQVGGEGAEDFDRRLGGGGEDFRRPQIERREAGQDGVNHGLQWWRFWS